MGGGGQDTPPTLRRRWAGPHLCPALRDWRAMSLQEILPLAGRGAARSPSTGPSGRTALFAQSGVGSPGSRSPVPAEHRGRAVALILRATPPILMRPAGFGAAGNSASAVRALSPGWKPRPATPGPALEAPAARLLDWGVVSERGRGVLRSRAGPGPGPVGTRCVLGAPG